MLMKRLDFYQNQSHLESIISEFEQQVISPSIEFTIISPWNSKVKLTLFMVN